MAAGMSYNLNPFEVEKEYCRQETIYRLSGGFNLAANQNIANGIRISQMCPILIDFATRTAKVCKRFIVHEAYASGTTIKLKKSGGLVFVGMNIGNGTYAATVTAVDTSNALFDLVTVGAAFGGAIAINSTMYEAASATATAAAKDVANFLNYAPFVMAQGVTLTAIGQAFEIKENILPIPVIAADKAALGARFMFV